MYQMLVRCIPVSPWPACVDDVSSVDFLVEVVVTVVVSGPTVQTTKYLSTNTDGPLCRLNNIKSCNSNRGLVVP